MNVGKKLHELNHGHYFWGVATGLVLAVLLSKLWTLGGMVSGSIQIRSPFVVARNQAQAAVVTDPISEAEKEVLPEQYVLGVSLGDTVTQMIADGVIDADKFTQLYSQRGGIPDDIQRLLTVPSTGKLVVTRDNAGYLLNILWPLGIANRTSVLSDGPIGTEYKDDVGQFASTGGWTLGKKSGGELFNSYDLIRLTPQQETEVTEIAKTIYRSCCGNSTYFPDCNHGAAMLAFIELAVAQGETREQIYKDALALNSYWFPQTYEELAIYFKKKQGTAWADVDPQKALGQLYSSGAGYAAIDKELQADGYLPKVQEGSSCGA